MTSTRPGDASIVAITIQPRQLRVAAKTGEQLFEQVEFGLGFDECGVFTRSVEEEFDLRSHRAKRPALHYDVLVMVSGGSVTTRTEGADAAASCACFAAAICACRDASCLR